MILGGSPISVPVPPILEAMIWVMMNGTGSSFSAFVTAKVMGPTNRTVVTLSRKADRSAVMSMNATMITHGLPPESFADLMAMYSNRPDFFTTATKIIMLTRMQIVSASM